MKKLIILISSLLMMAVMSASWAADKNTSAKATDIKIGVIDVQQILQKSPQMEAATEKLKKQFKPRQDKITELQKKIGDNDAKLKRDSAVMSQAEVIKLQDAMKGQQRDLRRMEEDYMQDAQKAQQQTMDSIVKHINAVVQKIADKEHYDLIVQKNTVAFASPRVDITNDVVKALKDKK